MVVFRLKYTITLFLLIGICSITLPNVSRAEAENCLRDKDGNTSVNLKSLIIQKSLKNLKQPEISGSLLVPEQALNYFGLKGQNADNFLKVLCSEYSDNKLMLDSKLNLYSKIKIIDNSTQKHTALLKIHKALATFRQPDISPIDECEMRFIQDEYVEKNISLNNKTAYETYSEKLKNFRDKCTSDELSYYVNFRGDAYLKPYSPEASAMEARARIVLRGCDKDINKSEKISEIQCRKYRESPYYLRYKFAEEVLRSMLFYEAGYLSYMSWPRNPIFIEHEIDEKLVRKILVPDLQAGKFAYKLAEEYSLLMLNNQTQEKGKLKKLRNQILDGIRIKRGENADGLFKTLNVNWDKELLALEDQGLFKLFSKDGNITEVTSRLSALLSRQAYFYRTFIYDTAANYLSMASTPLSSSSYYMHQSHKFTFNGYASNRPDYSRMHWMFIYRVKKEHLYTGKQLARGIKPNFIKMWFSENDYSSNEIEATELAWDKFAGPAPEELKELLWLGRVQVTPELIELAK